MELLGLPLPLALEMLPAPPTIIETAPPASAKRVPIWGELRVLRVREREAGLELLVARELLGEAKDAAAP